MMHGLLLFVDSNYSGAKLWVPVGSSYADLSKTPGGSFHDKLSSSICEGAKAKLWIDKGFLGKSWVLDGSVPTYGGYGNLMDNASSLEVFF